jgi:dissimilatory sulfite reductase (desulfoviridin) alpha/beta subunit
LIPRPSHRAVGEERAWGKRLARRFGVESSYDDQSFTVKVNAQSGFLDHETLKPEKIEADVAAQFATATKAKSGVLIVHGWTMAESLAKLGKH